jgi:DNA-binding response OmpR family regulator
LPRHSFLQTLHNMYCLHYNPTHLGHCGLEHMRIAVLDDDPLQLQMVLTTLQGAGHHVYGFALGKQIVHGLQRESFDLVILDWQVPDLSGLEVLQWLRRTEKRHTPVMFTTLRSAEEDIIAALDAGADDYMIKPIRKGELTARVQALLRRSYPQETLNETFEYNQYRFEAGRNRVSFGDQQVILTQKEFDLALLLFRNMGRALSRSHILESVWGRGDDVPSRTMDTHMSRVRSKLNLRPENGFRLAPVYSFGYRLEPVTE